MSPRLRSTCASASLRTSSPKASTPAASSRKVAARSLNVVRRRVLGQPGVVVGAVQHRAHQAADGHRRVLQRLHALPKPGLDVRRADCAQVEPTTLLRLEQGGPDSGDVMGDSPGVVQPLTCSAGQAVAVCLGHLAELVRSADQQLADRVGQPVDGAPGIATGDLGWEEQGGDDAHGRPDQRLGDPLPGSRLRADLADAEDEHGADRHLDQVGAQPEVLTDGDRDQDEDAEAPPLQRYDGREPDCQHHSGHDCDDTVEPAGQQGQRRHLHHEHRRQRREQRLGAGEDQRRHDIAGRGRDGDPRGPQHGRATVAAHPRELPGDEVPHPLDHVSSCTARPADFEPEPSTACGRNEARSY